MRIQVLEDPGDEVLWRDSGLHAVVPSAVLSDDSLSKVFDRWLRPAKASKGSASSIDETSSTTTTSSDGIA